MAEGPSAPGGFGVGSRLAGYRLDEHIGRGGMAVVYRAYDTRLERQVAVKVLAPELAADEAFRQRFIRESRTAAAVDHPQHHPDLRGRRGRRRAVHRHALRAPAVMCRSLVETGGPAAGQPGLPHHLPGRRGAGGGARARPGAPGRQAGQHPARAAAAGYPGHAYLSDFGLSKHALSAQRADLDRPVPGHAGLHRAGADRGPRRSTAGPTSTRWPAPRSPCSPGSRRSSRDQPVGGHVGADVSAPPALTSPPPRPARRGQRGDGQGPGQVARGPLRDLPGVRRGAAPCLRAGASGTDPGPGGDFPGPAAP